MALIKEQKKEDKILARVNTVDSGKKQKAVWFFLAPLFLLLSLEVMHLSDIASIQMYFQNRFFVIKFIISYVYILSFQCFFTAILPNAYTANVVNCILFYVLSLISYIMVSLTGTPLLPTDLLLVESFKEIASFVKIPLNYSYFVTPLIMIFVLVKQSKTYKSYGKINFRFFQKVSLNLFLVAIFLVSSYFVCINYKFRYSIMDKFEIPISAFAPVEDLKYNGMVLTFFPRIGSMINEKPDGYDEQKIKQIKNENSGNNLVTDKNAHPNIIAIQNESFWNPEVLENVKFSQTPIPNIKRLASEGYPSGYFVSPVFGGGTCLPEFEYLTGLSTAFLPSSTYPYIQNITSKTPTIVSTFKDNGYETTAIHPYHINFYNRDKAYPLMGFENIKSIDNMKYKTVSGLYISDDSLADEIIDTFENKKKDRIFCYGVSMQNHGTYESNRYKNYDIDISCDTLSEDELGGLKSYTQGVYDGDKFFNKLVEYFKNVKEPTILIMYGDHLPLLGSEESTYMNSGYVEHTETFESSKYPKLYHTPYIVWANYDISSYKFTDQICGANLGIKTMQMAGLKKVPWYYGTFAKIYEKYPVFLKRIKLDSNLNPVETEKTDEEKIIQDYKYLQYDILSGKQYSSK